jgi:hypothetical protein
MAITVQSSVEILADQCFSLCHSLRRATSEENSKLKTIGQLALTDSSVRSFTIQAPLNETNWSAFVDCPLEAIDINPGNQRFIASGNVLLTPEGTAMVKFFGLEGEIIVPSEVEILQESYL